MKVNTDGVIAAALTNILSGEKGRVEALDIGTGTGVIALIIAQRLASEGRDFKITAIDIDKLSADEAGFNFRESPWSDRMEAICHSISDFSYLTPYKFDIIISNPPYFSNSLKSESIRRSKSRHTDGTMSLSSLMGSVSKLLKDTGRFTVILPSDNEYMAVSEALAVGLTLSDIVRIKTMESKPHKRVVLIFSKQNILAENVNHRALIIQGENGEFTPEYKYLTTDLYLQF